jgi:hypothetical protein
MGSVHAARIEEPSSAAAARMPVSARFIRLEEGDMASERRDSPLEDFRPP